MANHEDVELFAPESSEKGTFGFKHAERILKDSAARKVPTWELSEKSKKTHDFVNGKLITRSDKGKDRATSTEERD